MATIRNWTGAVDGDYSNGANWDTGAPASTDTADFGSGGATKIVLNANTVNTDAAAWIFDGGDYTNIISGNGSPFFFSFNGAGVQVDAGSAIIKVIDLGRILFFGHSDGGSAEYDVNTNGILNFGPTVGSNGDNKVHVGSIEGDSTASILLAGGQQLIVGSNNLDTNYAGSIGPAAATPGSMVKVGTGTLTLSGSMDQLQSLTIAGGTVELAGAAGQDIGEIDFAASGGVMRHAQLALAETLLAHHPVTHIGIPTDDDDDGTILGGLTQVLDIEGGLPAGRAATHALNHLPTIRFFGRGAGIDNAGLPFAPGATAKYTGAATHEIIMKSGANTVTFDNVLQPGLTHFAALSDDNGGTLLVPAIIETRAGKTVDGSHHPPHQPSPGSTPDVIVASGANDTVKGLGGKDILVARAPGDALFGGGGADFFVFDARKASPATHPDIIMDFHHTQGDAIDLYGLFHATHGQALAFIGRQSFAHYHHTHAGVLGMVRYAGGELQVNFDHRLTTEFAIVVHGAVHPGDLIL